MPIGQRRAVPSPIRWPRKAGRIDEGRRRRWKRWAWSHLLERIDDEVRGEQTLSGGEKQRPALWRTFLHNLGITTPTRPMPASILKARTS